MFKKIALLPILLCLTVTTALAEGFYGGAGLGLTQIEDEDQGISFKDNPLGWRLLAGYDVTDNFAIEGSYVNSGEAEDTVLGENVKAELSAFTLSLVGLIPVGDKAQLFGKLGYYDGEEEVTVQDITFDEDADGATVGVGVRFNTGNNFAIRGEFDWFNTELDTLWSVGVGFHFYFGQ